MIDNVKPEDPNKRIIATIEKTVITKVSKQSEPRKVIVNPIVEEILIAPVEKMKTTMCKMKYHVTDAT